MNAEIKQQAPQIDFPTLYSKKEAHGGLDKRIQLIAQNFKPSNKKHNILSIDGGGVRCVIAMEALHALEKSIQLTSGNPNRLLSDEFDLVAGTSAGGMLASAIAMGMPMDDIRIFVEQSIQHWFSPAPWYRRHKALYELSLIHI